MSAEIWMDVKGREGLYRVSNQGRVKTIPHTIIRSNGWKHFVRETVLAHRFRGKGARTYLAVRLYNTGNVISASVHRLVAIAFKENPYNLPLVNHIDGDKMNNNDWNLEWCTEDYNIQHANNELNAYAHMKTKVMIYDLNYNEVLLADSIKQAAEFVEGSRCAVRKVCIGVANHHKGYKFKFAS